MKKNIENIIINSITTILKETNKFILIKNNEGKIIYPKDNETLKKIRYILKQSYNDESQPIIEIYDELNNKFYKIESLEFIDDNNKYYIQFIENISKQKYLERENKYDNDTEVYNKKTIERKMDECISRLTNFSLVICDIDNFKIFNDTYGHSIGDEVLIKVADIFKKYIGSNGFVGRYGGDEFILILKNFDEDKTLKLLDQVILEINNIKINYKEKLICPISISCGIYTVKKLNNYILESNEDVAKIRKEIFDKADKALYFSKENGRNQANIYTKQKEKK